MISLSQICPNSPPARSPRVLLVLLLGVMACDGQDRPERFLFWSWSQGPAEAQVVRYVTQHNQSQSSAVARLQRWPLAEGTDNTTAQPLLASLASLGQDEDVPALLEVPDTALAGLVEAETCWPIRGTLARRTGLRFDDFFPWLMPHNLVQAQGVPAFPFLLEVPLVAFRRDGEWAAALRSRGWSALRGESRPPGRLAVAGDHRLVQWALRATTQVAQQAGGTDLPALDEGHVREAIALCQALGAGQFFPPGPAGEEQARQAFLSGQAEALLVWSSQLSRLDPTTTEVIRAPLPPRGTFLVINAEAPWRQRQAAFRLARWLTEPLQTAQLARELWTSPLRQSAARGAVYQRPTRLPGEPAGWRQAIVSPGPHLAWPAREELFQALVTTAPSVLTTPDPDQWASTIRRLSQAWQAPPPDAAREDQR